MAPLLDRIQEAVRSAFSQGQNQELSAEITRLTEAHAAEKKRADEATASLESLKKDFARVTAENASLNANLTTAQQDLAASKTAQEDFDKKVADAAAKKAVQQIAASGLPAEKLEALSKPGKPSHEQLLEQFNKITDPKERGQFYLKHFSGNS